MKRYARRGGRGRQTVLGLALLALGVLGRIASAQPVGTVFTFQGNLVNGGTPVSSPSDLQFRLFDALTGGAQVGPTLAVNAITPSAGRFTVDLDFGAVFAGSARYIEIAARTPAGSGSFTTLTPRQPLNATPYAIFALAAGSASTAGNASTLNGQPGSFYSSAANLTGTVPDARLSTNVPLLNGTNVFGATNRFGGSVLVGGSLGSDTGPLTLLAGNAQALRIEPNGSGSTARPSIIGGSPTNTISGTSRGAVIAGGGVTGSSNSISGISDESVIAGGKGNTLTGNQAVIGGGGFNAVSGLADVLAGGAFNTASNTFSTISGGTNNAASGSGAVVAGGQNNQALGGNATVSGGGSNVASGSSSAVPGGSANVAGGTGSMAAGIRAKVRDAAASGDADGDEGTFVWSDSAGTDFISTGPDQFLVRATGGVGIGTNAPEGPLHVMASSAGTVVANASSVAVLERAGNGYLSILTPVASESGVLFGTPTNSADGGVTYNTAGDRTLRLRTGGNVNRVTVTSAGDVGIGTIAPAGRLHVVDSPTALARVDSGSNSVAALELHESASFGAFTQYDGSVGVNQLKLGTINSGTPVTALTVPLGTTNVQVIGTLSKGGGSFKIDHPLDPERKYLYHSFVESPDMMNIYNGNVVTDGAGNACIELPAWFEALNRDFRYQLTVVDSETFALARVTRKVQGNRFCIATNLPHVEVSWQVTGIRQDPFANANRIPVEEEKAGAARGRYLHPEARGLPAGMSETSTQSPSRGAPVSEASDADSGD